MSERKSFNLPEKVDPGSLGGQKQKIDRREFLKVMAGTAAGTALMGPDVLAEAAAVKESSAIAYIPDRTKESFQLGQDKDVRDGPVISAVGEIKEQEKIYNKMGIVEMRLLRKEAVAGIVVYEVLFSNNWKVLMAFPEALASGKTVSKVDLNSPKGFLEHVIGEGGKNKRPRVMIEIKPGEIIEYKICELTPDSRNLFGVKLSDFKTGQTRYEFYIVWSSEDGKRWGYMPAKAKNKFTVKVEDKYVHIKLPDSPTEENDFVEYQVGKKPWFTFIPELKHRINIPPPSDRPTFASMELSELDAKTTRGEIEETVQQESSER